MSPSRGIVTQPALPMPYPVGAAPFTDIAASCASTSLSVSVVSPKNAKIFLPTFTQVSPHG